MRNVLALVLAGENEALLLHSFFEGNVELIACAVGSARMVAHSTCTAARLRCLWRSWTRAAPPGIAQNSTRHLRRGYKAKTPYKAAARDSSGLVNSTHLAPSRMFAPMVSCQAFLAQHFSASSRLCKSFEISGMKMTTWFLDLGIPMTDKGRVNLQAFRFLRSFSELRASWQCRTLRWLRLQYQGLLWQSL